MKKLVLHNWSDKQAEAVVDIITTIGNKVETAEVSFNQACNHAKQVASKEIPFQFNPEAYV